MRTGRYILMVLLCWYSVLQGQAGPLSGIANTYLEVFQGKCGQLEQLQIWSITPGNDEYVFFASNEGLGVYDGVRWEIYRIKGGLPLRSLYFDSKSNTLYCGAVNQFGKWTPDACGRFEYTPLWQSSDTYMEFWNIDSPGNGIDIYAQSHQAILRYHIPSQKVEVVGASDNFKYMHMVSGDMWVQEHNMLCQANAQGVLKPVIAAEDRIVRIERRDTDGKLLVFFEHEGVYVLSTDLTTLSPLYSPTNAVLGQQKIFTARQYNEGEYLVGTTRGGLYVLSADGRIQGNMGENRNLPTSTVLSIGIDHHKDIWLGLDLGIAALYAGEQARYITPKPYIGNVRSVVPMGQYLYAGSNQGLFRLTPDGACQPVEGTSGSIWSMHNIGGELVFNHDQGLFRLQGNTPVCIKRGGTTSLVQSYTMPSYFVGGDYYGLTLYKMVDGQLTHVGKISNYSGTARYMKFDKQGYLWIALPKEGFLRLQLSADMLAVEEVRPYTTPGYDADKPLLMGMLDGALVFYDGSNAYQYQPATQQLVPDAHANGILHQCGEGLTAFTQQGNIFWYQSATDIGYVVRTANKFEKQSGIFARLYNKRVSSSVVRCADDTWAIGFQNGIALYHMGAQAHQQLHIRMLEAYGVGAPLLHNFEQAQFVLPYNKKIIRVYPINLNPDRQIEYRIPEQDTAWTREVVDNALTLTWLESGNYTLQVRNAGDYKNTPAQVQIKIRPPWYVSPGMLVLYSLCFVIVVLLMAWYFQRKGERDKQRIERNKREQLEALEHKDLIQSQRILELEKENLKIELQEKDKRLTFITMNGVKRNDLMNELKNEIQQAEQWELSPEARKVIRKVMKKIEYELQNNDDWDLFANYFNVVFSGLLERLAIRYPQLSQGDMKLLAYIKLNLNNKEIANLLNISHRSVEMAKYRLRRKLGLEASDNFSTLLNEV